MLMLLKRNSLTLRWQCTEICVWKTHNCHDNCWSSSITWILLNRLQGKKKLQRACIDCKKLVITIANKHNPLKAQNCNCSALKSEDNYALIFPSLNFRKSFKRKVVLKALTNVQFLPFEKNLLKPRPFFSVKELGKEVEEDDLEDLCFWCFELIGDLGKELASVSDGLIWELSPSKGDSPPALDVIKAAALSVSDTECLAL